MNEFVEWLEKIGNFHDSSLVSINLDFISGCLEFVVADVYANLEGFDGYRSNVSCKIRFTGVSDFSGTYNLKEEGLMIFDFSAPNKNLFEVKMSPSGIIQFAASNVDWSEFEN